MILIGDVREKLATLPSDSVHCCVTSPPYFRLRDYGCEGQIGLEKTPEEFIANLVDVFREVKRVLHPSGVCFVNIGDSYNGIGGPGKQDCGPIGATAATAIKGTQGRSVLGLKAKDLCLIPWRLVLALQMDGWYVRDIIVWHKPAPMPESVTDRCTKAWEPIFMLAKSEKYFWDQEAVSEVAQTSGKPMNFTTQQADGIGCSPSGNQLPENYSKPRGTSRNPRNVWKIAQTPFAEAHFACFPEGLPERCIKAGTSEKGCCPKCLSPWRRVTEKTKLKRERPNDYTKRTGEDGTGNHCANTVAGVSVETLGWEPTCSCDAGEPIPCTVLDCFGGSGTTGRMARLLGRKYILCELNPEYAAMAERRINAPLEKVQTFKSLPNQRELFS